jgi:FeS assembly protein IscX
MGFKWIDTEEIALALLDRFPNLDPLSVRFTDLHKWVIDLPDFEDNPSLSSEKNLEAIQMEWYNEYNQQ